MNSTHHEHGFAARTQGPVRIVGTGLLGTSIGLALRELGVDVILANHSPKSLSLAVEYGAGRVAEPGDTPTLVVVCVPPDVTAEVVAEELATFPDAIVTEVASVKSAVLSTLQAAGVDLSRYVGSHPMAGRERGGAIMGRTDLFVGRPWVICSDEAVGENSAARQDALGAVEALASDLGATPITMTTHEHDERVALVSHLPQVMASLTAARLVDSADDVSLAGQGLRDTTRIAASDPALWVQILSANSAEVVKLLTKLRIDLDHAIQALETASDSESQATIVELLTRGNEGVARIPGKHGSAARFTSITVAIDDKPGELARLLTEIGELGINLEDMRLEHSPGAQIGFVELSVLPSAAEKATIDLTERGWSIR